MLYEKLLQREDISAWEDAYYLLKEMELEDSVIVRDQSGETIKYNEVKFTQAHAGMRTLRGLALRSLKESGDKRAVLLHKKSLLFDAPFDLDCAIRYAEYDRDPKRRFYQPRRMQLKPVVDALQELEERKIRRLYVALPPGTGKSTLAIFFMIWSGNRRPDQSIFGSSHNGEFLKSVYREVERMLEPEGEYLWSEIFPKNRVVKKNAKDLRIDINTAKRFETFEFSPIGAGSAGKVRASNLIYADDLVSGIEEAMSIDRMNKLWSAYTTDILSRTLGDDWVELMIQTPWSLHDPIDRNMLKYADDPSTRIITLPALNEKDESNFDYPYGLGHTTESLHAMRDQLDDATWRALYMMSPIEREGQLYSPDELQYYTDLPDRDPDSVIAVCDSKEQGTDDLVLPIAYQYGDLYYIDTLICDNGNVEILEDRVANALAETGCNMCCIESNRGGTLFARNVTEKLKEKGAKCSISTKWNEVNKDTRIITRAGTVKKHFLFRSEGYRDKEYDKAMRLLYGYSQLAKKQRDDVPDALSMLVDFLENSGVKRVRVARRPF